MAIQKQYLFLISSITIDRYASLFILARSRHLGLFLFREIAAEDMYLFFIFITISSETPSVSND